MTFGVPCCSLPHFRAFGYGGVRALGSGFKPLSCMSTGAAMGKLGAASIAHMEEEGVYSESSGASCLGA